MKNIHIIDCGIGNISSVANAFEQIGATPLRCSAPEQLTEAGVIVLPGVGAFGDGMGLLVKSGFKDALLEKAHVGCTIFGICLGMQLLLDKSYEFGEHAGLGLIPGVVRKVNSEPYELPLPHIGWNDTTFVKDDPLLLDLCNPSCFYYVNSYYCDCEDTDHVLGTFEYGDAYPGIIRKDNIMGVQFHPEKSQRDGLRLLEKLVRLC